MLTCNAPNESTIKVAVASNARFALEELAAMYTKQSGYKVELIVSSSGKLTAQILEGAPFDVFLSADLDYPNELFNQGKATHKPVVYAYGTLGLWTTNDDIEIGLQELENETIRHIACANPKTAPYGRATIEVLNNLELYEAISEKLIFGESVSQVSQFVYSKAADVGFISSSIAKAKGKGRWFAIDSNLYSPISQGAVVIKQDHKDRTVATQFLKFLASEDAEVVLKEYGYRIK